MPSKSQLQHNFWGMLKHSASMRNQIAKERGASPSKLQNYADEFIAADKGGKYDKSKGEKK